MGNHIFWAGLEIDLQPPCLADGIADRMAPVERRMRVLEDELHMPAHEPQRLSGKPGNVLPVKDHLSAVRLDKA